MKGMTNDDLKEAIGVMVGKISKSMEGVREAVHEFDTLCEIAQRDGYVGDLYRTDYTVTGRGPFPLDMLRYTQSWPKDEQDARAIEESLSDATHDDAFTIRLTKTHRDATPNLSDERWTSKFRWKVLRTDTDATRINTTRAG